MPICIKIDGLNKDQARHICCECDSSHCKPYTGRLRCRELCDEVDNIIKDFPERFSKELVESAKESLKLELEAAEEFLKQEDQSAKADLGKPKITKCPTDIIRAISVIREFGDRKYEPDSWKNVDPQRYRDAMMRHALLYIDDPYGLDEESGLPHLWHMCCNAAFLCYFDKEQIEISMAIEEKTDNERIKLPRSDVLFCPFVMEKANKEKLIKECFDPAT